MSNKTGYANGLRNAENAGRIAAEHDIARNQNPYRRWEFRKAWEDGWDKAKGHIR